MSATTYGVSRDIKAEPDWSSDSRSGTMPASPSSIESNGAAAAAASTMYNAQTTSTLPPLPQQRPGSATNKFPARPPTRPRDIAPAGGVPIRPAVGQSTGAGTGTSASAAAAAAEKKKLASGKRADQNRKAQRAFRQRKDKYIKDLELRSQELDVANSLIIQLKEENDRLNEIAKSFHNRIGELEAQLSDTYNGASGAPGAAAGTTPGNGEQR